MSVSKAKSGLRSDLARAQRLLDEQELGTVVVDKFGHAWQSDRIYWYRAYGEFEGGPWSSWDLCQLAPITVVHKPTRTEAHERIKAILAKAES